MNRLSLLKIKRDSLLKNAEHVGYVEKAGQRRIGFEVDPSSFYPATIDDIIHTIETNKGWTGISQLDYGVVNIDQRAWELALILRDVVDGVCMPHTLEPEDIQLRAQALELARLWFTEKLHQAVDHEPMNLRITRDLRWKLF